MRQQPKVLQACKLVCAWVAGSSVETLGWQWPVCALCLGQFLEGTGSLKGLEQGRDVVQHILERLAHSSDLEKS